MTYFGADVGDLFNQRWRSNQQTGVAAPWCEVKVRRGRLARSYHDNWPNPQFGQVAGRSIRHQWYADWTPLDDWTTLDGVASIDLDQNFDKNGITVATLAVENQQWVDAVGHAGMAYHERQRGYLWPWRGWKPPGRPGSGDAKNDFYGRLPNAQILIRQGYGEDTATKTFTGLIDTLAPTVRPDRMQLTCRDFGGVLTDSYLFAWNKDRHINDPITFIPPTHPLLKLAKQKQAGGLHRWIIIHDATDIVRCVLRWAGFKEWEIENSGVNLSNAYTVDKTKSYMDIINDVKAQLGYVFFMGEPTDGDLSIGVPVFRRSSVLIQNRSRPRTIRDQDRLTDIQPQHDNGSDRYIIRVRGVINKKIGRGVGGDTAKRVTFTYWPPWMPKMAGVIKQITHYNIGDASAIGFQTVKDCTVACVLIAVQIALARDTATVQTPGQPGLGLDCFAFVTDAGTGVASRLYITNRKSTMKLGGDGTSALSTSQSDLLWTTEIGGSLVDNPEFEHLYADYQKAIHGQPVLSWGTPT